MYLSSEIYSKSGCVVAVVIAVFVNNQNADSIIKCVGKQKFTLKVNNVNNHLLVVVVEFENVSSLSVTLHIRI